MYKNKNKKWTIQYKLCQTVHNKNIVLIQRVWASDFIKSYFIVCVLFSIFNFFISVHCVPLAEVELYEMKNVSRWAFQLLSLLFVIIAHIPFADYTWHILVLPKQISKIPNTIQRDGDRVRKKWKVDKRIMNINVLVAIFLGHHKYNLIATKWHSERLEGCLNFALVVDVTTKHDCWTKRKMWRKQQQQRRQRSETNKKCAQERNGRPNHNPWNTTQYVYRF